MFHCQQTYKNALKICNQGKPDHQKFMTSDKNEHLLDYMINLADTINVADKIGEAQLIPIATDPFGNIIAYRIDDTGKIGEIVFWNHETRGISAIADSFELFMKMLY
jgi:hypothetical protein